MGKPAGQSRIGTEKPLHQLLVAGCYDNQIIPVVFHGLEQRINGFLSKVVFTVAAEGIGLVDEKHAPHGFSNHLFRFQRRLSHIAGHQTTAVCFHQVSFRQNSLFFQDLCHHPRQRGLAGTGASQKHHVQAQLLRPETAGSVQRLHFCIIYNLADNLLGLGQARKTLQLLHCA